MKKIFSMVLVALMLITSAVNVATASENSDITASVSFSAEDNSITVKGDIKSNRDRIPMTMVISQNGNVVAMAEMLATGKSDIGVSYLFESVKLNNLLPNGNLEISVSADMVNLGCQITYPYIGIVSRYNALKEFNDSVLSGDASSVLEVIKTNHDLLGIDISALNDFDERTSILVAGTMNESYALPETCVTEEDIKKTRDSLGKLKASFSEGIIVGEFFDCNSSSDMSIWYDEYKDTYSINGDISETAENEKDMLVYVTAAFKDETFIQRKFDMTDITNITELFVSLCHQSMLHLAEKGNSYVIRNIIDDFPTLVTINSSGWNSLSETNKGQVIANVSGKSYKNFIELSGAVNSAITQLSTSGNFAGGISGGSSGGSSGGGMGKNWNVESTLVPNTQSKTMRFADIAHVGWAEPSIRYLYSKGIVNGRSEDIFAPDDVVTRAELVKMLAVALNLKNTETPTESFADVADNAWYADYVYAAVEHGLIEGDGNGLFNPEAPVTRQDAATIIYRAAKDKLAVDKAYFEDYESIAPYARDAVDYLCAKGIVNGIGDGIFAPNAKLSRAQAAKVLHLFLTIL